MPLSLPLSLFPLSSPSFSPLPSRLFSKSNLFFFFLYSHSILKPRPQTPLDAIKFICKDLWTILFRKQIDNLKTNHRGVFVLTDARFQPMSRMSVDRRAGPKAGEEALRRAYTVCFFFSLFLSFFPLFPFFPLFSLKDANIIILPSTSIFLVVSSEELCKDWDWM